MYSVDYDLLLDLIKEVKVKEDVKQAFVVYLFLINSNDKKHSQLKKTVAIDHAKGDGETLPSSCHAALTLMNDFKPLIVKGTTPVAAQGTAFAQKQKGAGTPATSMEGTHNKEYFADKECHTCGKKGHAQKKVKAKKDSEDNKLVSSDKSAKTIKSLN